MSASKRPDKPAFLVLGEEDLDNTQGTMCHTLKEAADTAVEYSTEGSSEAVYYVVQIIGKTHPPIRLPHTFVPFNKGRK